MQERLRLLLHKYLNDSCSTQELEEFFTYVRSADHDEHLRHLIRDLYEEIKAEDETVPSYVDEEGKLVFGESALLFELPKPRRKRRRIATLSIAAGTLVIIIGAVFFFKLPRATNNEQRSTIAHLTKKATDRSEYKYMLLPDSTQVWLNASSTLEFPEQFDGKLREVTLSGEAYFDVKHAQDIPFVIHTGQVATTVLGTAFNIKAYPGFKDIIVSVSRGKVKVTRGDQLLATLTKGQQVKVGSESDDITKKQIDETDVAAWQKGKLVYDDERFEEIVTNLKQIYNADVIIENQNVQNLRVSTTFSRETGIQHALEVLCKLTDTRLKEEKGVYYIK